MRKEHITIAAVGMGFVICGVVLGAFANDKTPRTACLSTQRAVQESCFNELKDRWWFEGTSVYPLTERPKDEALCERVAEKAYSACHNFGR